ncbi:MAG: hypothetical protein ABEI76_05740 [Halobacteriales archaeon]
MVHECDDCGATFETLTRLRLHDCGDGRSDTSSTASNTAEASTTASSASEDRPPSVDALDEQLDRSSDGDTTAIHTAVAEFESALSAALEEDRSGDAYRDIFWPYYERVSNGLDRATQAEGWELLDDVIDAYDPTREDELPLVTPAIANAVGRYLIRTRLTDGVEAIAVPALEYLDAVADTADDSDDIAREEVHAYGWGIGHPDHSVVDHLRARIPEDIFSINPSLEHAFYADQYAAVEALEELVRDESIDGTISRINRADMPYRRYLLDCVYGLKTDEYWPKMPRYYDWHTTFDYTFELEEAVEQRIRELVVETGFDTDLPADWTFRDLGI